MKISIVTVCFNEEKNIERTIKSVLRQSNTSYEYIICDGKSTDKTVEIAESYRQAFEEKGIEYIIKSEKDGGIYFGMNNGIDMANGDYVIFMNAGDCFHGVNAIKSIVDAVGDREKLPDVVYGNATFVERGYYEIRNAGLIDDMCIGMPFFHQSALVRTDLIKETKFDTSFRICADFDMFSKFYTQKREFYYVDAIISDFYAGGISCTRQKETAQESFRVRDKNGFKYDKAAIEKKVSKGEKLTQLKTKMPFFLWALWCKLKKRKKDIELGNEELL